MPLRLSLTPPANPSRPREIALAPEATVGWVAALSLDRPLTAGRSLADQMAGLNTRRLRITVRQELSELIYTAAEKLLPALEHLLEPATVPLTGSASDVASVTEDLINQLYTSYKILLVEQSRRMFGFASSGRALLPTTRAMMLLARRLALSYRIYSSAPKGVWTEMHELYRFAARRGLTNRISSKVEMGTSAVVTVYKRALLLAFTDPLRLVPGDVQVVEALLEEFADHAVLGMAEYRRSVHGVFVIKPQRDLPGYAISQRHHPVPQDHDLVLNTLPLVEALIDKVAKLSTAGVGLPQLSDPARLRDLMTRLVKHWGAVPNRRFNRLRTHARVEICVGIPDIWTFLNNATTDHCKTGEWMVINESPRGFALMHTSGPMTSLKVGEVVGLRARAGHNCHVCVVRWVLSDNSEHLELGLEELAPTARAASVRKLRGGIDIDSRHALLLPEVPSQNQPAALLAPLMLLDSTCELSVGELQAKFRVRPTRLVERTPSVQMLQFSSVT